MISVCFVTGSRAEYGLLKGLMDLVIQSEALQLQTIVTGSHLSPEFGMTIEEIENDKIPITQKIEMLLSTDSNVGVSKSVGLGVISLSDAFAVLLPDVVVLLGDRFEIYSAATAAFMMNIPIAHIHGGERTDGSIDDTIRHCVSKMSRIHFVAAEEYGRRVIQMGEDPMYVFNVGALATDNILSLEMMTADDLQKDLSINFLKEIFLVTVHPETARPENKTSLIDNLIEELGAQENTTIIFSIPNADPQGNYIHNKIKQFCLTHSNAHFFRSLGRVRYLSLMNIADAVIGNSSSGLIEAPAFGVGTINIGNRQGGRLKASSVIDCDVSRACLQRAFKKFRSKGFQQTLKTVNNPYYQGGAAKQIVEKLEGLAKVVLEPKIFNDLKFQERQK